jgi:hypothetical protein
MKRILLLALVLVAISVSAELRIGSDKVKRQYPTTEIYINNLKWGAKNGCSKELAASGRMVCGVKPNVSEVTWWCVGTNLVGDLYLFNRRFPAGEKGIKPTSTNVVYSGKEVVVWKDDVQQLILRPAKTSTNQTAVAVPPAK